MTTTKQLAAENPTKALEALFLVLPPVYPHNYQSMRRVGDYIRHSGCVIGKELSGKVFQAILQNVTAQGGLTRPLWGKKVTPAERLLAASQGPPRW